MSSTIDKIIDRIPYAEGAFRRSFTAGVLFVIIQYVGIQFLFEDFSLNTSSIQGDIVNLIQSPAFLIILFSLVFTIGTLIEVSSYILVRNFSGLFKMFFTKPPRLTEVGQALFIRLPEIVREGLTNPLGQNFHLAWRYLSALTTTEEEKRWLIKMDATNKLVFSVSSSLFFSFIVMYIWVLVNIWQKAGSREPLLIEQVGFAIIIFVAAVSGLSSFLALMYILSVRISILQGVEYLALKGISGDITTSVEQGQGEQKPSSGDLVR